MDKELLLAKFVSNTLSTDELKIVQHLLDTDLVFKEEVAFQKSVKLAATAKGQDHLKSPL